MKYLNILALAALTLILCVGFVAAQEMTAAGMDKADAGTAESIKGRDLSNSKESETAELINAGTYAFSAQSGIALDDMSTGTTQLIANNAENANSAVVPTGFLFRFDGTDFSTFGVSSNGLLRLGGAVQTSATLNALNSAVNAPKLAPFWDHLCVGATGKVHYRTFGIFGFRKLVVEWKNVEVNRTSGGCTGTGNSTFQVWIFEDSGIVQFVYGSNMAAATLNGGYSVGIQSGAATNFASVSTASSTVDYVVANNTQTGAINQGTAYLFSPNIPATPAGPNVTNIRQTSLQLNWTDNANNEGGYYVWRTTDTVNYTLVGQLPPNTTSFTSTGLIPATQYRHIVRAVGAEGSYSGMLFMDATTNPTGNISSTAAGGLWSSPSTWVGGLVPDGGDNVTIVSGATVIIDTAAVAGSVSVGSVGSLAEENEKSTEGGSPAVLRFGETAAFSLTVAGNVTIGANDTFSTGGGSANQHVLTVSGNLTNNGTFDLSTNNNLAAATLVFKGASNNTFGGTGAVTDIRIMTVDKGGSNANILEMNMSNFSVQGSTTDTPASGFLFLDSGTLKISGTFSGTHRTFFNSAYQINGSSGLWLNNPNYTITGQQAEVFILGLLRISAGTYNFGTVAGEDLNLVAGSTTIVEGGNLVTAGNMGIGSAQTPASPITYDQSGGTVTTCTVGRASTTSEMCFDMGESAASSITMSGGHIVIQNSGTSVTNPSYKNKAGSTGMTTLTGTTVHFGNASTSGDGFFRAAGRLPNLSIDTVSGPRTVQFDAAEGAGTVRNVNIGTNGTLGFAGLTMVGTSFVNNGTLVSTSGSGNFNIDDGLGLNDVAFSGTGIMNGIFSTSHVRCHSLTIDPSLGNMRFRSMKFTGAAVHNAARLTIGNNDALMSALEFYGGATLDSTPDYIYGAGGLRIVYSGVAITGPELPNDRTLFDLSYDGTGSLTITGGDLTITNFLRMTDGLIFTGQNRLILFNPGITITRVTGYVAGTVTRRIPVATSYTFPIGLNGYTPPLLEVSSLNVNPSFVTIRTVDATLPGLLPATSVSRHWKVDVVGDVAGRLTLSYTGPDTRGNEVLYKLWRNSTGTPVMIPGSIVNTGTNQVFSPVGMAVVTGDWGIGGDLDPGPVSVSGRVTTSTGNGIPNATVTISGGGLPAPITVNTGSLGFYTISNLQAGETYTVTVSAKRHRFPVGGQMVTPMDDVENLDFTANPQEELF